MESTDLYKNIADGIIDADLKWDSYFEGLGMDTNTPGDWVKAKKTKDEIRAELKSGFISQTEENMGVIFPKLLKEFEELNVPERNGAPYADYIRNIMRPISQMSWFKDENIPEDVYAREIAIIEDERDDIEDRIQESKSLREQKAYRDLLSYLEQKEDSLNVFFNKPLSDNLKAKFKAFVKKSAKTIFSRTVRWIKKDLPEFLAGLVVSVGSMIFGIYELAMNMGKGIMEKSKAALKDLEKKIKEYAEKQGEPLKRIMNMIGGHLGAGGDSLGFILAHILGISIVIAVTIFLYYQYGRVRRPRVRVRYNRD